MRKQEVEVEDDRVGAGGSAGTERVTTTRDSTDDH